VARISNERESFSRRLRQALKDAHHAADSPTELARDFNSRTPGPPITAHAARKWLVGEAIPTQEKMRTLAEWLMVPVDWLRFGGDERLAHPADGAGVLTSEDLTLMADLQRLGERERRIVREFIHILVRANRRTVVTAKQLEKSAAQGDCGPVKDVLERRSDA
jgi:hypothetical protein